MLRIFALDPMHIYHVFDERSCQLRSVKKFTVIQALLVELLHSRPWSAVCGSDHSVVGGRTVTGQGKSFTGCARGQMQQVQASCDP